MKAIVSMILLREDRRPMEISVEVEDTDRNLVEFAVSAAAESMVDHILETSSMQIEQ